MVWVGKIGETRDLGRLRVRRDVDAPSLPNSSNSSSHSKSTATFVGGCGFVGSVMVCSCRVVVAAQARSDRKAKAKGFIDSKEPLSRSAQKTLGCDSSLGRRVADDTRLRVAIARRAATTVVGPRRRARGTARKAGTRPVTWHRRVRNGRWKFKDDSEGAIWVALKFTCRS